MRQNIEKHGNKSATRSSHSTKDTVAKPTAGIVQQTPLGAVVYTTYIIKPFVKTVFKAVTTCTFNGGIFSMSDVALSFLHTYSIPQQDVVLSVHAIKMINAFDSELTIRVGACEFALGDYMAAIKIPITNTVFPITVSDKCVIQVYMEYTLNNQDTSWPVKQGTVIPRKINRYQAPTTVQFDYSEFLTALHKNKAQLNRQERRARARSAKINNDITAEGKTAIKSLERVKESDPKRSKKPATLPTTVKINSRKRKPRAKRKSHSTSVENIQVPTTSSAFSEPVVAKPTTTTNIKFSQSYRDEVKSIFELNNPDYPFEAIGPHEGLTGPDNRIYTASEIFPERFAYYKS